MSTAPHSCSGWTWEESVRLLCALPGMTEDERIAAVTTLVRSPSASVRKRALRLGADILPDDMLVDWLREDANDVLRNAGLEVLKLRGGRGFTLARELTQDTDPDVVLQAALLLDYYRDPRGVAALRALLDHHDPNVVQAAILGLGHHRDPQVLKDLERFLIADPWLQIAAVQALGDLADPRSLPILAPLLDDAFLESFAAESLARVGGTQAFRVLSAHWLIHREELDSERYLALFASLAIQLTRRARLEPALQQAIEHYLLHGPESVQTAASVVLLALGPAHTDIAALRILANAVGESTVLPPCLAERDDIAQLLLESDGVLREWGLQLAARYPEQTPPSKIREAVLRDELPEHLADAAIALAKSHGSDSAGTIVAIFERAGAAERLELQPAIIQHGAGILGLLPALEIDAADRLVIEALAGHDCAAVVSSIARLPEQEAAQVIPQVFAREDVVRRLPWETWIELNPSVFGTLLAEAVVEAHFVDCTPLVRRVAASFPSPNVIEALARIGDAAAVEVLEGLLTTADARLRAFVFNALGEVGGDHARAIFRRIAPSLDSIDEGFAYRAWAQCAGPDDLQLFRSLAAHPNWMVRAAAAQVLARYPDPTSASILATLALDPVEAVAENASDISLR
ncbi:MAG: HEAT repeat domain-containing protein [Thermoanaerobaculia bacterium]